MRRHLIATTSAIALVSASAALAQAPEPNGRQGGGAPAVMPSQGGPAGGEAGRADPPDRAERGPDQDRRGARAEREDRSSRGRPEESAERNADRDRTMPNRPQRADRNEQREEKAREAQDRDRDGDAASGRASGENGRGEREQDAARNRQGDEDRREARDADKGRQAREDAQQAKDPQIAERVVAEEKSEVSEGQRERVRETFKKRDFDRDFRKAVIDVDIDVRIGTYIPRRYDLYVVPDYIVEIVPTYREYRYVIVEDEICIVDPDTYVVVAVYDYAGPRGGDRLTLTSAEERYILEHVERDDALDIDVDVDIGGPLPRSVELLTFPDDVLDEVPQVREYRYVVIDDDVLLVKPDDNELVLRIEG